MTTPQPTPSPEGSEECVAGNHDEVDREMNELGHHDEMPFLISESKAVKPPGFVSEVNDDNLRVTAGRAVLVLLLVLGIGLTGSLLQSATSSSTTPTASDVVQQVQDESATTKAARAAIMPDVRANRMKLKTVNAKTATAISTPADTATATTPTTTTGTAKIANAKTAKAKKVTAANSTRAQIFAKVSGGGAVSGSGSGKNKVDASSRPETAAAANHASHNAKAKPAGALPVLEPNAIPVASNSWANEVKSEMRFCWGHYAARALGSDAIAPVTGRTVFSSSITGGTAVTLVDSLDTLFLMGLETEFEQGLEWIESHLFADEDAHHLSVFESTIRGLGGLLGAYSLSGRKVLLEKAKVLGDALWEQVGKSQFATVRWPLAAKRTALRGLRQDHGPKIAVNLAELGSLQLEFRALGQELEVANAMESSHTRPVRDTKHHYQHVLDLIDDALLTESESHQAWLIPPNGISIARTGPDTVAVSVDWHDRERAVGGCADSYYEYLLKQYVQNSFESETRDRYKIAAVRAIDETIARLTFPVKVPALATNISTDALFIGKIGHDGRVEHAMEHLSCFLPGTMVLGLMHFETDADTFPAGKKQMWLDVARKVARTCYEMYRHTATGLAPEMVEFVQEAATKSFQMRAPSNSDQRFNLLRPEAVEAFYYLHYYTGETEYAQWAFNIFAAMKRSAKTQFGYATVQDVYAQPEDVTLEDRQESFFLAETLKYLYLIARTADAVTDLAASKKEKDSEDRHGLPRLLDLRSEYVLSTEAHPLRTRQGGGNLNRYPKEHEWAEKKERR
eukprot:g9562.t1